MTANLEPTPLPPTFYSLSQLGDHLHAIRWELAIVGAAIVTVGIKDWDWGNASGFQTIEEGWFAEEHPARRHGQDRPLVLDLCHRRPSDGSDPGQCLRSRRRPDHSRAPGVRHHGTGGDRGRVHRPAPLLARGHRGQRRRRALLDRPEFRPRASREAGLADHVHARKLRAARHHRRERHSPAIRAPALHHGSEGQRV